MDIKGVEAIVEGSKTIVTWSMSLLAGSLLTILSTEYSKLKGKRSNFIYLLFIPGWLCLISSIYFGNRITGRGIMAALVPERIPSIVDKMNDEFGMQQDFFNYAIIVFGTWLLFYLSLWIRQDFISKSKH